MDPTRASLSALAACLMRAVHTRSEAGSFLRDPYGDRLVTAAERDAILARLLLMLDPAGRAAIAQVGDPGRAFDAAIRASPAYGTIVMRTRYVEDQVSRMVGEGVSQYVLIGAGFDTFALRHADLADRLTVFEIDHAATLDMKRQRFQRAGLDLPAHARPIAVDVEQESVAAALAHAGHVDSAATAFSCVGLMPYLSLEANRRLLRDVAARSAPGSALVFDYLEAEAVTGAAAAAAAKRMRDERAGSDEPWRSGFDPATLPEELRRAGLELVEELGPAAAEARYTAAAGGVRMAPHSHLATARPAGDRP